MLRRDVGFAGAHFVALSLGLLVELVVDSSLGASVAGKRKPPRLDLVP
jgi:hypothetical protein